MELDGFRSYERLRLTLSPGLTLFVGDNATGKSNLLEAIALLAMTRSPRASTEGELIGWGTLAQASLEEPAVARVAGRAERGDGPVQVEIALLARSDAAGRPLPARSGAPLTSKRLRLNGIARRATEVVGQIGAVLFTTLDIEILTASPSRRRRFLDLMIAQSDRAYAGSYGRYDKALQQRNALLKRIGAGAASAQELGPWDDVLVEEGGAVMAARAQALALLASLGQERHRFLTPDAGGNKAGGGEAGSLGLRYEPALGNGRSDGWGVGETADRPGPGPSDEGVTRAQAALREALAVFRRREVGAGTTLVGPHRDDVSVLLGGRPVGAYASRAQQRSVALALRLAESDLLRSRTGESPILLLDDLFSELDPARREATAQALSETLADGGQLLVTTADAESMPAGLARGGADYRIADGGVALRG